MFALAWSAADRREGAAEVYLSETVGGQALSGDIWAGGPARLICSRMEVPHDPVLVSYFFRLIVSCAEDVSRTTEGGMSLQTQK